MNGIEKRPLSIKLRGQIIRRSGLLRRAVFCCKTVEAMLGCNCFFMHHIAKERSVMAEDGYQ